MLVGIDVGFSAKRASAGVARLRPDGSLRLGHVSSDWDSQQRILGDEPTMLAAMDAPYTTAAESELRGCERAFTLGAFQRRCKPGLSHVRGVGRQLRAAGWATARRLRAFAPATPIPAEFPRVDGCNVVEAFPNAYLGVCLDVETYASAARVRRGKKFDWLYDAWLQRGLFDRVLEELRMPLLAGLAHACRRNTQHDERAALVCLWTAAGVLGGRYTAVGDASCGWFFLPPWPMWAAWAREGLERSRARQAGLDVWIDGRLYPQTHAIPLAT